MNKLTITSMIIAAALSLGNTPSYAGNTYSPGVNKRQQQQAKRISKGMRFGALTKKEAFGLIGEQAKIHRKEQQYKSDGHLGLGERAKLHHSLHKASTHIYKQKHDGQHR